MHNDKSHHGSDGRFHNPPGSPRSHSTRKDFWDFLLRLRQIARNPISIPDGHVREPHRVLQDYQQSDASHTVTWLGHASLLLRFEEKTVLTDPFLGENAGPLWFGPKRYVPPAIHVQDLPPIDILCLSHNHYDHLCAKTLKAFPYKETVQVCTMLGLGRYFKRYGYRHIHEMDWHDTVTIDRMRVTALPAVHFSRRGLFDFNKTLWGSFAIADAKAKVFFGGDTAYGEVFKTIGQEYGPFTNALIGIGAYSPRKIMIGSHATPEEAIQIAKDIQSQRVMGMHWGTILLTDEPVFEPPERLMKAGREAGYADEDLWVMAVGETRAL